MYISMCITLTITFVIYKYIHVYTCLCEICRRRTYKTKSITTLVSNVVKCA